MRTNNRYAIFAKRTSRICGRPFAFVTAVAIIGTWLLTGPFFAFSDTWQLVINTGTTIITFLMVFLIQNTQNRDTEAIQLKLDELIVFRRNTPCQMSFNTMRPTSWPCPCYFF